MAGLKRNTSSLRKLENINENDIEKDDVFSAGADKKGAKKTVFFLSDSGSEDECFSTDDVYLQGLRGHFDKSVLLFKIIFGNFVIRRMEGIYIFYKTGSIS